MLTLKYGNKTLSLNFSFELHCMEQHIFVKATNSEKRASFFSLDTFNRHFFYFKFFRI